MEEIDIIEVFKIAWRKKFQIILIILIFIVLGYIYTTRYVKPVYTSSTTLVLASANEQKVNNTSSVATEVTINSKLVSTYTELIKSKNILEESISKLDINMEAEDLKKNISVTSITNTSLIELNVTNENPIIASEIANEISKIFIEKISKIYNIENVQIVDEAEIPINPSNINHKRDIVMFTLIGVTISILYVIIANMLDTTIKSVDELEKMFNVPILASIPMSKKEKGGK